MQQCHARRCRPKCSTSTITLVEADLSDTLLGNQARTGYGGDNERLRSAVFCCLPASLVSLQNATQLSRGEIKKKMSSPDSARNLAKIPSQV